MKRSAFTLFAIISLASQAFAQPHHEIAIDIAPVFHVPQGLGLMYRFNTPKFSIRARASVLSDKSKTDGALQNNTPVVNGAIAYTKTEKDVFESEYRIGLQKNFEGGSWNFYLGADFMVSASETTTTYDSNTPATFGTPRTHSKAVDIRNSYGVSPVLGISCQPVERIRLSVENGFAWSVYDFSNDFRQDYYFKPVNGAEALQNTTLQPSSGSGQRFEFSPTKFLSVYVAFLF